MDWFGPSPTAQRGSENPWRQGTVFGESIIKGGAIDVRNYQTGGKQYRVSEGETLQVEKLNAEVGAEVVFEEVLTVVNDADVKIGKPVVEGAKVVAKVVEHGKADKIFVFKYKAKSNYRKRQGHRQPFTTVEITAINA